MHKLLGTTRRRAKMFLAMVATVFVGSLALAGPASASTDYRINEATACRNQYGGPQYFAADLAYLNPYAWTCYYNTYGIPLAVTATPVGGVNFQKFYCDRYYPGSRAVLAYYSNDG